MKSGRPYGVKRGRHIVCAGNLLEGRESKMHRWRISNMVLWKQKQKKWCGNHIEKGACGEGSGIVEGNRQDWNA